MAKTNRPTREQMRRPIVGKGIREDFGGGPLDHMDGTVVNIGGVDAYCEKTAEHVVAEIGDRYVLKEHVYALQTITEVTAEIVPSGKRVDLTDLVTNVDQAKIVAGTNPNVKTVTVRFGDRAKIDIDRKS